MIKADLLLKACGLVPDTISMARSTAQIYDMKRLPLRGQLVMPSYLSEVGAAVLMQAT